MTASEPTVRRGGREHSYWALLAVVLTSVVVNSTGERFYKGGLRLAGTVVGSAIGFARAHVVGQDVGGAIVVVLAALFFAVYLMRINSGCWVIGPVVALAGTLGLPLADYDTALVQDSGTGARA